ncbi:LysR family transcriptional regulator [Alteromonas facilis]|uniref:LysR family transcriptional regulator n=1 Tax=Alteromonas facilis TaxID=2048004 RepID=UPI000C29498A|nr:LysR family transcriptional regulator [Alteromonas facilis]
MLNLKSINAFITLAESKTFAEAADKLHITQPALSSSIKKLEESLGGKLFSRNTRNVSLTNEGKVFLPEAKRLWGDCDNAMADMKRLFAVKQGSLTIAAMPSFAEGPLPKLLQRFNADYPNIRFRILDVVMEAVIECVLSGRTEIGFSFKPERDDGLVFSPLFEDKFIAVVDNSHPLASESELSWRTILAEPFIAMNRDSSVRLWLHQIAEQLDMPLNLVAEANQLSTVGQLVTTGMGVSIVPMLCRPQMLSKGLKCIGLEEDLLVKPVGIIKAKRRTLSVPAQEFWHAVLD